MSYTAKNIRRFYDKSELQQYLKDGYNINKLNVPVLGTCHGIPISEIFAPVILTDTESGQEQESGQPWDAHSHKISVIEDRRTLALKQRSSASKKLRSYKGIFIKENILQKKIFLLGKAGAGKSTFCKHLVDIWSNDNLSPQFDDAEFLKKFRYLFNVSCRFAEASESIFDMICNQLFCENDKMIKVACHVLKNTPEECLVVEDGIDEWKGSARAATGRRGDIAGLPSRKGLEDCVVLSTSRPERIHMLPDKLDKSCSVLELHGIENARQLIYSVLEKTEYTDPVQSCSIFLSQIEQNNMTDMIQCPLMLINALNIWDRNETLSNSMCVNYSNMMEGLFLGANNASRIKAHQQEQGKENSAELPYCFRDTDLCKRNSGLIVRLGKLAFDLLFSDDQNLSLIFSGQQTKKYLTEVELQISLAVGILSKAQTSSRSRRRIDSFSFCHKTFQEFLGALWLSTEQSKVMSMFLRQIRSIDTVLENKVFIQFLCGVSPGFGEEFWKYMAHEVIEKDEKINNLRLKGYISGEYFYHKGYMLQNQVLACIEEARNSGGEQHQQLYFFIPDIFYLKERYNDKQDAILIDGLMEKYVADIKSVVLYNNNINSERVKNMKKMKSAIAVVLKGLLVPDLMFFNSQEIPVLQFPDQLLTLKMAGFALTTSVVEFPLHLATLTFIDVALSHSVIEQLFSCLRVSSKLQNLRLKSLNCKDHGSPDCCCFPVLDLQKHNSLENVKLKYLFVTSLLLPGQASNLLYCSLRELCLSDHGDCSLPVLDLQKQNSLEKVKLEKLSVKSVLLPGKGTIPLQITTLYIVDIKMPHSGIEQLFACLCVSSNLVNCCLIKLCCSDHRDSCSDHGVRCCFPSLDLQNYHSLRVLTLEQLSVDSVLLPGQLGRHNTSGIFGEILYTTMINVNMSSQSWKRCIDSLTHPSSEYEVSLKRCNIDKDTRSYICSCSHFKVEQDDDSYLVFTVHCKTDVSISSVCTVQC